MSNLPPIESVVAQLREKGIKLPPGNIQVDGYGDSEALSKGLLDLIRFGNKRAGTGLLWAIEYDGEPVAQQGDIEVVLDFWNRPALVTRILFVQIVPYSEITAEYAAIEAEGDGSLDHWRRAHWKFFSRECKRIGREPAESMPVVCTVFEVLNIVPVETTA